MPRVITLDKGSKRKLRGIRWTVAQRISAAALLMLMVVFSVLAALWTAFYFSDEDRQPRLELRR